MKKILFILLALVLTVSISAIVVPAMASSSLVVNSDTTATVVGVYNEAGGTSTLVIGAPLPKPAVLAAEPYVYAQDALNSAWDTGTGNFFTTNYPDAHWIWETQHAEDAAGYGLGSPLYDPDASKYGRVVDFKKTFQISGTPQHVTLNIAADNCYEVWINGTEVALSSTAIGAGTWEASPLHEATVHTTGWQNVGVYPNLDSYLVNGTNTIEIKAGNEYFNDDDGNSGPAYAGDPSTQKNPGGLIFALDVQSVSPPLPELPAGLLFGMGLLGISGFVIFRRYRAAAASR